MKIIELPINSDAGNNVSFFFLYKYLAIAQSFCNPRPHEQNLFDDIQETEVGNSIVDYSFMYACIKD